MNHAELICLLAKQITMMFQGTLVGGGGDWLHQRYTFMKSKPEAGDLVVMIYHLHQCATDAIGWYVGTDFEKREHYEEKVYVIDRLDGTGLVRWTNAEMIRAVGKQALVLGEPIKPIRK